MGMLKEGEEVGYQSCFLDSEAPSGWTLAEDLEEEGQEVEEGQQMEGVVDGGSERVRG
jgi:hypothetical protein